jgi:hypothetical protein
MVYSLGMTNTRQYGTHYAATADLDIAEIAKLIRRDIKNLGLAPLKFSVRIDRFSMGQSIDVTISGQDWPTTAYDPHFGFNRHTPQAAALMGMVEQIIGRYNYDGSDAMTDYYDVRFYSHVQFA